MPLILAHASSDSLPQPIQTIDRASAGIALRQVCLSLHGRFRRQLTIDVQIQYYSLDLTGDRVALSGRWCSCVAGEGDAHQGTSGGGQSGSLAVPPTFAGDSSLLGIFLYFAKAGMFVFGSGLAVVPFLYGGVVQEHHWLTDR